MQNQNYAHLNKVMSNPNGYMKKNYEKVINPLIAGAAYIRVFIFY